MSEARDWESIADDENAKITAWSSMESKVALEESPPMVLERVFGFPDFRPGQKEVIDEIVKGRDAFLVMPTGGGKSLCYQIPAIALRGTALIISPLIALMKDQVDALEAKGVSATYINSSLSETEVSSRIGQMAAGKFKLVYVAPERVNSSGFMKVLRMTKVSMVAVDEAHCVSKWGHDFRPAYRKIPKFLASLNKRVPVVATTATATVKVRKDIVQLLSMNNPIEKITGFRRTNLELIIRHVDSAMTGASEFFGRAKANHTIFPSSIVYLGTKRDTEDARLMIQRMGIPALHYHGGMTPKDRNTVQERFMSGEIPVVCATNAFGMGVDKADIRYVIHATMPGSIESYYQEVGRAGRDGKPSKCIMYVDYGAIELQQYFIKSSHPSSKVAALTYEVLIEEFQAFGNEVNRTYKNISDRFERRHGRKVAESREIGQVLTLLKRNGVFRAPKRGVMILNGDHDSVDFETFDTHRAEAEARLKEMLKFTSKKDLHRAIVEYFGAEA